MTNFLEDIKKFEQKALDDINNSVCNAYKIFTSSVISLSPTKATGKYSNNHLINQWYSDIGNSSTIYTNATNPSGLDSTNRVNSTLSQKPFYGKDNVIYFTNNLPYAYRVETLGWPSGTPGTKWRGALPYGMVSKSLIKLKGEYM